MTLTKPPHGHSQDHPAVEHDTATEAVDHTPLLPQQLLQPGEIVVLLIKPSVWYILLTSIRTIAIICILATAANVVAQLDLFPWQLMRRDVLLVASGTIAMKLFWQFLEWLSRVYVLTDRRVIRVKGVIRVVVFEAALKQIQHTQCLFSLRERCFGLGTITFATAGIAMVEAHWIMVAKPLDVHQTIVRTLQRFR